MSSGNPKAFDTERPSAYGTEFPFLPSDDALNELTVPQAPPIEILNDPDRLFQLQDEGAILRPPSSPGSLETQTDYTLSETSSERPNISSDFGESGLTLSEVRDPFYRISKTARAFDMEESATVLLPPYIPMPTTVFEKERARRLTIGSVRIAFEALASTAYIDNVFGAASDPQSDVAFSFSPKFYLEAGTKGFLRLYYAPNFLRYQTFSQLNSTNQLASVSVRYPFTKLRLGLDAFYQDQSGLFLASNGQSQQQTYLVKLSASYPFSQKTSGIAIYEGRRQVNTPGGEKYENSIEMTAEHQFGTKLFGGTVLKMGYITAPGGEQTYQTLSLSASYRPSYHFLLVGQAGLQHRNLDPPAGISDLVTPVFDLSASYHPNANTSFKLRAYREINEDTFGNINFGIVTGVEANILLRFYQKTEFKIGVIGGYAEQFSNVEPEESNFSFLQGELRISYPLVRRLDVILFDNLQKRFNDSRGGNYVSNTIGIGLDFRF